MEWNRTGGGSGEIYIYIFNLDNEMFKVNETYVGVLKDIVRGLAENGIYSYLDMHQVCHIIGEGSQV